jgi:hypothetical protein
MVPSSTPPLPPVAVAAPKPVVTLPAESNHPLQPLSFSSARKAFHCAACPAFAHQVARIAPAGASATATKTSSPSPASLVAT